MDNSATTQPCGAAVFAARRMLEEDWFNPSALYRQGAAVEAELEGARKALLNALGGEGGDVLFTGSGTEADALAVLGSAARLRGPRRLLFFAAEHPAVLETAGHAEKLGHRVSFIPSTGEGTADLEVFSSMLDGDVGLVSCMQVNNETGAVQPIAKMAALLRARCPEAVFHVDGVQGFLRAEDTVRTLGADLYTTSAHKVHGLKGVGALWVKKGVRLQPVIPGGGQEKGLRSGTENTAGVLAFSAAVAWVREEESRLQRLRRMKARLFSQLSEGVEGLRVNGPDPESPAAAPHILNVSFPGARGEVMLHALEAEGVLVGTGAACSSKKRGMSPAFRAMGAPAWAAEHAVRFSLSVMNTEAEMDRAAAAAIRAHQTYGKFRGR